MDMVGNYMLILGGKKGKISPKLTYPLSLIKETHHEKQYIFANKPNNLVLKKLLNPNATTLFLSATTHLQFFA